MELLVCVENNNSVKGAFVNFVDLVTGQSIVSFKSATAAPRTLCHIGEDYIIHALEKKSVLHILEVTRSGQQPKKIVTPGVVNAMCSSEDGTLLAAGIDDKVLIWDVTNGQLLSILSKHYQQVSNVQFTNDGAMLVSSSEGGLVLVWDIAEVLSATETSHKPLCSLLAHTLPVTGICLSTFSQNQPRIYSSSHDRTVKIHDIYLGKTILCLVFQTGISCIAIDNAETLLCAGGANGFIYMANLISVARKNKTEIEFPEEVSEKENLILKAHSHQITGLTFNLDCSLLISSAQNEPVKVWDVRSGQCLRVIKCSSGSQQQTSVSNTSVVVQPSSLSHTGHKPSLSFPKLAHVLNTDDSNMLSAAVLAGFPKETQTCKDLDSLLNCSHQNSGEPAVKISSLHEEVTRLKEQNQKLYEFAIKQALPKTQQIEY